MELKPGTILQDEKYVIRNTLGAGGFGITYLAEHPMLNKLVCIKEFFPREYYNRDNNSRTISLGSQGSARMMEAYRNKFIKEARTIARLQHPNVISIHDVFEENNTAYYVMEYIEGDTLSGIVKRCGAMDEATALGYIFKVASALKYIHEKNLLHLDIKPANIMVRRSDNHVVLIDFGLSKQYDEQGNQTSTTPVGISPGYAPPEQYEQGAASSFSAATDIYALGATLYFLTTGKTPPSTSVIMDGGLEELVKDLSPKLRKAIITSMQPSRSKRPATIENFLALFDESTIIGRQEDRRIREQEERIRQQQLEVQRKREEYQHRMLQKQPQPPQPQPQPEVLPNYMKPSSGLGWAIVSTLLCCLPLGIVSIIKATKVNELWNTHRYQEATQQAKSAKRWIVATFIIGLIMQICSMFFFIWVEEMSYDDSYYEDYYGDYYEEDTDEYYNW